MLDPNNLINNLTGGLTENLLSTIESSGPVIALFGVLLASLIGSLHCIGMCGPIVVAVAPTWQKKISYNLGRLYAYLSMSLLFAYLGRQFLSSEILNRWQKIFIIIFSLALVVLGLKILWKKNFHFFTGLQRLQQKIFKFHISVNSIFSAFFVGLTSVLLPCGWLYSFIFISALVGEPALSLGVTFFFWLGTLPSMILGPQILKIFLQPLVKRAPKVSGILLIVVGLFIMWQRLEILPNSHDKKDHVESCH